MPELVWDRSSSSLNVLVYVLGAEGIEATRSDGTSTTYCKVTIGKSSFKTKVVKKTRMPSFKEFFFFDIPREENNALSVELWDVKKGFLGHYLLSKLITMEREVVHDLRLRLGPKESTSSKKAFSAKGELLVRVYISDNTERRPKLISERQKNRFFFDCYKDMFRTGDLILFSGFGVIDSAVKLFENSNFSRIGMIVKLTNPYTERVECYLLEVTRNTDRFLDVFKEKPNRGICIFRLEERLHHYHGHSISWASMKGKVSAKNLTRLKRFVMNHHRETNEQNIDKYFTPSHNIIHSWLQNTFKIGRHPAEVLELFSCHFFRKALAMTGLCEEISRVDELMIRKFQDFACFSSDPPKPLRLPRSMQIPSSLERDIVAVSQKAAMRKGQGQSGEIVLEVDGAVSVDSKIPDFSLFHRYVAELAKAQTQAYCQIGRKFEHETVADALGASGGVREGDTNTRARGTTPATQTPATQTATLPAAQHPDTTTARQERSQPSQQFTASRPLSSKEALRPQAATPPARVGVTPAPVLSYVTTNPYSSSPPPAPSATYGTDSGHSSSPSAVFDPARSDLPLPIVSYTTANPYSSSPPSVSDLGLSDPDTRRYLEIGDSIQTVEPDFTEMAQDDLFLLERSVLEEVDDMLQNIVE